VWPACSRATPLRFIVVLAASCTTLPAYCAARSGAQRGLGALEQSVASGPGALYCVHICTVRVRACARAAGGGGARGDGVLTRGLLLFNRRRVYCTAAGGTSHWKRTECQIKYEVARRRLGPVRRA
jgi:hypothetical protein